MSRVMLAPEGLALEVSPEQTLLEASLEAGVPHVHVCGGNGRCSTCRVLITEGLAEVAPPNAIEAQLRSQLHLAPEVRVACQLRVNGPLSARRLVLDDDDVAVVGTLRRQTTRTMFDGSELRLAILFADVRGFTAMAEALLPYDAIHILNRHFEAMGRVIDAEGGVIANYMGDGLMALFGLDGREESSLRAVRAGLTMLEVTRRKTAPYVLSNHGWVFDIGVGIHVGEVVVGPLGAAGHATITAIGDAVNFASRIESANKDLGTRLLASDAVLGELAGRAELGRSERISLKGKCGQHRLHEVRALRAS